MEVVWKNGKLTTIYGSTDVGNEGALAPSVGEVHTSAVAQLRAIVERLHDYSRRKGEERSRCSGRLLAEVTMKVEGTYTLPAPRQRVWELLNDPAVLARATPGVKELQPQGNDVFKAIIELGIGPVKGTYAGQVSIADKVAPQHMRLIVEGGGKPGTIKASGELRLEEQDGRTVIAYSGDAQITGLIASVGHRLIGGVAKQMATDFFKALERELTK